MACFLCCFLRLAGGAGASAHLEKTANGVESVAFFASRPFARGAKKRTNEDEQIRKTLLENAAKNEGRSTLETHQQMSEHEAKWLPKSTPGASFAPLGASAGALGGLGSLRGRKKTLDAPKSAPRKFPSHFLPPSKPTPTPRGGARRVPHLHFGSLFLEIAAGASAGCKNRGVQGLGGHSWGWGEKLKLLQQQASLLFKASLREA